MGIVAGANLHRAIDCPFRAFGIGTGFSGHMNIEVFHFIDDFRVASGEAVIQSDREIRPCLWCAFIFHNIAN